MTPRQRQSLAQACGRALKAQGFKPTTAKGQALIFNFYLGAAAMAEEFGLPPDGYLQICLVSGRLEALVEMPS